MITKIMKVKLNWSYNDLYSIIKFLKIFILFYLTISNFIYFILSKKFNRKVFVKIYGFLFKLNNFIISILRHDK